MPRWHQSSPGHLASDMASCGLGCSTGRLFSVDRPIATLRYLDLDTVKVWEVLWGIPVCFMLLVV